MNILVNTAQLFLTIRQISKAEQNSKGQNQSLDTDVHKTEWRFWS